MCISFGTSFGTRARFDPVATFSLSNSSAKMDGDIVFDFEKDLVDHGRQEKAVPDLPTGDIGQQPRNFVRNYRKVRILSTVRAYASKGRGSLPSRQVPLWCAWCMAVSGRLTAAGDHLLDTCIGCAHRFL